MRDKVEKKTGEKKMYLVNVSAEANEMVKRAEFVAENGKECILLLDLDKEGKKLYSRL